MPEKKDITREMLRSNIMRQIIIRIDYQGITEIEDFVKLFKEKFIGNFRNYNISFLNNIDIDTKNLFEIEDNLSIPIKELTKQEVHKFTNNTFGNDKLTFDISRFFSCLTIDCTNYNNIDPYIGFYSDYVRFLCSNNHYLDIRRIGIRKIGGDINYNFEDIFKSFEKSIFYANLNNFEPIRCEYIDILKGNDDNIIINHRRRIEKGNYFDEASNTKKDAYQTILDIDGYMQSPYIDNPCQNIQDILRNMNDNYLFNIFKSSVTLDFLNRSSQ